MADEPKVEKRTTDNPENTGMSSKAQQEMNQARREGRAAAGVDVQPGNSTASTGKGLDRSTAQGYGQKAPIDSNQSTNNGGVNRPSLGLPDEDGLRDERDSGGLGGSKKSNSPKEPYHYDGLYGEMPENTSGGGGGGSTGPGYSPFRKENIEEAKEGENQQPTGDTDSGTTSTDGTAPAGDGASELDEAKKAAEAENADQEGKTPKEGKDGEGLDTSQSNPELDNAKAVARDAGMAQGDIDNAQKTAEEMSKKMDSNPDMEKALDQQLDENAKKQALEEQEKGGSSKKKGTDSDDKEKTPEEKAKEEGTDAAAAGMASNPNAMNQGQDPTGNGYRNPAQQSKMDDINRRNLEHNNQVNNANRSENPNPLANKSGQGNGAGTGDSTPKGDAKADSKAGGKAKADAKDGQKGKLKGKAGAAINKAKSAKEFANNPFKWGANKAKNALVRFLLAHPMLLFAIIFALFFILLIFVLLLGGQLEGGSRTSSTFSGAGCNYTDLKGITTSGTVDLSGIQVELINCDGKEDNYTVLEHIDFEKYVIGVALAEVSWSKSPEYFKAQIVAARGFALKRNSSMCPSHPDNCFYGYNASTKTIRLRACTNDQVYCDPDKPCYHYTRSGKPTIYGPEAEGMAGATVWKGQLSEQTKADVMAAAKEVEGKVLVDSSGNVVYTNFVNTDQNQWYEMAQQGMKWDEILIKHYASSGASGYNSATCQGTGNIDYGDYSLKSDGDVILNQRLDQFLASKGTSLDAFNALIASNVDKAGFGTRAGVVAAAVTLIGEMGDQYNTKIPYFLSGGHHDGVRSQALGYWGSGYEDDGRRCYYTGYGNVYTVCGLDCSGFVPWAIKTGGFNPGVRLAGNFQNISGAKRVSLSSSQAVLQPGDLLESSGHIVLVVGVDEGAKQYICAEASGKNAGVLFTRRPFSGGGGYWGVKMDGYYNNPSNVRSK